jgi:hypothetical protein
MCQRAMPMGRRRRQRQWNLSDTFRVKGHSAHVSKPEGVLSMINLLITLVVVGVLLWLVNTYIPMDGKIKSILNVVIVIVVILWLLQSFGILSGVGLH